MKRGYKAKKDSVAILNFHDGGAGQIASWFEEVTDYRIACFVAESLSFNIEKEKKEHISKTIEFPVNHTFKGRPVVVSSRWGEELKRMGIRKALPMASNNRDRLKQIQICRKFGIEIVSAIHPTAVIMKDAIIQPGVVIRENTIIGYKTEVESGAYVQAGSQIDHHGILERCCRLDGGVVLAGNVTIRECSYIHTGATIINRIEIGKDAIIGAGAVVIDNIPARCTAVGVPAKVIKHH